jgi:hypothetical protein
MLLQCLALCILGQGNITRGGLQARVAQGFLDRLEIGASGNMMGAVVWRNVCTEAPLISAA